MHILISASSGPTIRAEYLRLIAMVSNIASSFNTKVEDSELFKSPKLALSNKAVSKDSALRRLQHVAANADFQILPMSDDIGVFQVEVRSKDVSFHVHGLIVDGNVKEKSMFLAL